MHYGPQVQIVFEHCENVLQASPFWHFMHVVLL